MNVQEENIFRPQNISQLVEWLHLAEIDLSVWGKAGAKTVEQLWHEVESGESILQHRPTLRHVNVVRIILRQAGRYLVEVQQQFMDGSIRKRRRPPTEKILAREAPETAALRGIAEELDVDESLIITATVVPASECRTEMSPSYPGLLSCYWLSDYVGEVTGLPTDQFVTVEVVPPENGGWLKHYWEWDSAFDLSTT